MRDEAQQEIFACFITLAAKLQIEAALPKLKRMER
jgi:hypothetical protein